MRVTCYKPQSIEFEPSFAPGERFPFCSSVWDAEDLTGINRYLIEPVNAPGIMTLLKNDARIRRLGGENHESVELSQDDPQKIISTRTWYLASLLDNVNWARLFPAIGTGYDVTSGGQSRDFGIRIAQALIDSDLRIKKKEKYSKFDSAWNRLYSKLSYFDIHDPVQPNSNKYLQLEPKEVFGLLDFIRSYLIAARNVMQLDANGDVVLGDENSPDGFANSLIVMASNFGDTLHALYLNSSIPSYLLQHNDP